MKLKALGILALSAFLTACCCDMPEPEKECVAAGSRKDFCENVGDRVYFDFDKSVVGTCGHDTLKRQAEWLCRYKCDVTIVGHCDERGTSEYNIALGERRAKAAREVLISYGVPASRITICSMGKENPIVAGKTEEAYKENRVAITVLGRDASMSETAPAGSMDMEAMPGA